MRGESHLKRRRPGRAIRGDSRRASPGQGLVELALVLPVLLLLFAGAADLGRALTAYIELGSAAREGAAYGSQNHGTVDDTAGMVAAAQAAAPDIWGTVPTVTATGCSVLDNACSGDSYGYSFVTVNASYTFTPILGGVLGIGPLTMQRSVEMRVIN
jgi:Flp pilus assembly protein TadG